MIELNGIDINSEVFKCIHQWLPAVYYKRHDDDYVLSHIYCPNCEFTKKI